MLGVDRDVVQQVCKALQWTLGYVLVWNEFEKGQTPDRAEFLSLPAKTGHLVMVALHRRPQTQKHGSMEHIHSTTTLG